MYGDVRKSFPIILPKHLRKAVAILCLLYRQSKAQAYIRTSNLLNNHYISNMLSKSFNALIGIDVGFLPSCAREFHGDSKIVKRLNGMEMIGNCSIEF